MCGLGVHEGQIIERRKFCHHLSGILCKLLKASALAELTTATYPSGVHVDPSCVLLGVNSMCSSLKLAIVALLSLEPTGGWRCLKGKSSECGACIV